jgi:hypothetical protein
MFYLCKRNRHHSLDFSLFVFLIMLIGISCQGKNKLQPVKFCEINESVVKNWWGDHKNVWTPLGWKDHLFRFNVFYNGTIIAQPYNNRRTTQWEDINFQLTITPFSHDNIPNKI